MSPIKIVLICGILAGVVLASLSEHVDSSLGFFLSIGYLCLVLHVAFKRSCAGWFVRICLFSVVSMWILERLAPGSFARVPLLTLGSSFLVGLLATGILSYFVCLGECLVWLPAFWRGINNLPPRDGQRCVVTGIVEPLAEPFLSPITLTPSVACWVRLGDDLSPDYFAHRVIPFELHHTNRRYCHRGTLTCSPSRDWLCDSADAVEVIRAKEMIAQTEWLDFSSPSGEPLRLNVEFEAAFANEDQPSCFQYRSLPVEDCHWTNADKEQELRRSQKYFSFELAESTIEPGNEATLVGRYDEATDRILLGETDQTLVDSVYQGNVKMALLQLGLRAAQMALGMAVCLGFIAATVAAYVAWNSSIVPAAMSLQP